MRYERSGRDCVADVKKLRYPKISSAEIHTVKSGDFEQDLNSDNKKIKEKYISPNTPLAILVGAARFNQTKQSEVSKKNPIKQIVPEHIQKEIGYATPKNIKF